MARKSKQRNTFKNPTKKKAKGGERKILPDFGAPFRKIGEVFKNPMIALSVGLVLLLLGSFMGIGFASYLFTWKSDQALVIKKITDESGEHYSNWLGSMGAKFSHQFMHEWFGVASFFFVIAFLLLGVKLVFKKEVLPLRRTLVLSFFLLFWISLFLGFLFDRTTSDLEYLPGGRFGYQINQKLIFHIGKIGALLSHLFMAVFIGLFGFRKEIMKLKEAISSASDKMEEKLEQLNEQRDDQPVNREVVEEPKEEVVEETGTAADLEGIELKSGPELAVKETVMPAQEEVVVEEAPVAPVVEEPKVESIPEETVTLDPEPIIEPTPEPEPIEPEVVEEPVVQEFELTEQDQKVEKKTDEEVSFSVEENMTKEEVLTEKEIKNKVEEFGPYDPTLDLPKYKLPTLDLLKDYGEGNNTVTQEELELNKNKIVETLNHYKIKISKIKATIGPTVTLYEIVPAPGVRISKIKNLEDDIALSLAALGIRIIAPIPGKGTIGIEVPNQKPDIVSMRTVIASDKFQNTSMELPLALGKTISNETFIADLAKMPHLLMAGATGQGKSVGLNCILASLLYKKHPSQIKFVLVDPKKVELTLFNKIERHFLAKLPDEEDAIITDTKKVITTLNSLCVEMDARYELLKDAQVRNLKEYNAKFVSRRLNPEKGHRFLPYIVLVVDEFADLIMTAGKEVETPIARLAQLARAIGIHLIIATQRPSVNIITGTIKANFPARIAFRVTAKIDSRTILDAGGADQLIGRGDMLLSTGSEIIRLQCAFVDTPEVEQITDFIGSQQAYPSALMLPEFEDESSTQDKGGTAPADRDALFEDAARLVVQHQQGSASLLQRRLKLGYNRAGRIIDQLEDAGIIGPFEGSKARKVLLPDELSLEQYLENDN